MILPSLIAFAAFANARALPCETIASRDGLLIVDTQNDFMAPFPIHGTPQYTIPPVDTIDHGTAVRAGSLAVGNSSEIIKPINDWIARFTASSGGRVYASLDWHPANHCSYCRNGTAISNPSGFKPHGGYCGPLPQPVVILQRTFID